MEKRTWYIEGSNELDKTIEEVEGLFPCFITATFIEMNYMEITIEARTEDMGAIKKKFAPYM